MKNPQLTAKAGQLSEPAFLIWFNKLPFTKQFQHQRAAGFSPGDLEHLSKQHARARQVGLPADAPAGQILYHLYKPGGGVGCGCEKEPVAVGAAGDVVAVEFPMKEIFTDTARFQNRTDAFSELSAEAVARHYDPNKFDPIVLWRDPAQGGRAFVLSGHSRHEGKHRRGDATCPARFFQGTEAEAIQFARVDANRTAAAENLVEDLTAYRLMRDGDEARNLKPAKKADLNRAFRGKATKLEAWSHLSPGGLFIQTLSQDNRTEFPYLEKFALWTGQARARHPDMTATHESDTFNFLYADGKAAKLSREDFDQLVDKRMAWGKPRLFPECNRGGCVDLKDLTKRGAQADTYKELELLAKYRETISQRLRTSDRGLRVYTDTERAKLKEQGALIDLEATRLRKDLNQAEATPGLFGLPAGAGLSDRVLTILDRAKNLTAVERRIVANELLRTAIQ